MRDFIIATGNSRTQKIWKNTKITWDGLVNRLKETQRTSETLGEYRNMTKSRQDDIKDVGGFVGGELKNGSRREVINRSILTLDVDYADVDFLENFKMLNTFTYALYSTHKHTEEHPRLRLIFPLSRVCTSDEYEAVGRAIAKDIGIDYFDDSTYQAQRLMYYPSTSLDGSYVFDTDIGTDVDIEQVLKTYDDWTDVTSWAVSSRTIKKHQFLIKKQELPTDKKGIVGAFCRTYSVNAVIDEFLSDTYTKCTGDRYTFTGGSTSFGAIMYEDGNFLYSNHATDPAGGILCNAFDLMRIHKFAHLDEDVSGEMVGKNLPSYKKMVEFASSDTKVKQLLHTERLSNAKEQFREFEFSTNAEDNTDWVAELDVDKKGNINSTIDNIKKILSNDSSLKGRVKYNDFTGKSRLFNSAPWDSNKTEREWTDSDDAGLRHYLETVYKIKGKGNIDDAWILTAKANSYHPIKDFLNTLIWDGLSRVETLFIDYLGADDNEYVKTVSLKALTACVARVFNPGCKFDIMPVLIGPQGCGKSYMIKKLGKEWFTDTLNSINDKNAYEQIKGFWIVEIAELSAMKRAEIESIKHFITKTEDAFRGAYLKHVESNKRQCVFFGSTNKHDFLTDMTGNRRFMPIDVNPNKATKNVFKDLTECEISQIWAEAMTFYKKGEKLYIEDASIQKQAEIEQDKHLEQSPLQGDVENFLQTLLPKDWDEYELFERRNFLKNSDRTQGELKREKVCIMEIWCELLGGEKKELTRSKSLEICQILEKTGNWEKTNKPERVKIHGLQKCFYKKV